VIYLIDDKILIYKIIDLALEEDGPDITSEAIFLHNEQIDAAFYAKSSGIIAGLDIADKIFKKVDASITFMPTLHDGTKVKKGAKIADVHGPTIAILKAERVVLNFMQRMSGIATVTARYVKKVKETGAKILDTRKTAPGCRILDKYAVRIGGGINHRFGLYDMALIKDNHIDKAGSITKAVMDIKEKNPAITIEVETRSLEDIKESLELNIDRVMLDNFSIENTAKAVALVGSRVPLEASGGVTLKTVKKIAQTGVDFISVGELTHSVKALDISMKVVK